MMMMMMMLTGWWMLMIQFGHQRASAGQCLNTLKSYDGHLMSEHRIPCSATPDESRFNFAKGSRGFGCTETRHRLSHHSCNPVEPASSASLRSIGFQLSGIVVDDRDMQISWYVPQPSPENHLLETELWFFIYLSKGPLWIDWEPYSQHDSMTVWWQFVLEKSLQILAFFCCVFLFYVKKLIASMILISGWCRCCLEYLKLSN